MACRGRRLGAWIGGGGVLVLALALAWVLHGRRAADASWAELERFAEEGRVEWESRDFRRPALAGETTPGSAFEHYGAAVELARELGDGEQELLSALHGELSEPDLTALRVRWAPVLAHLRSGARAQDARPPARPELGFSNEAQRLLHTRSLVNIARVESVALRALGREREAVEWLLDAATLGADLVGSPLLVDKMVGTALVDLATAHAWQDEELRALDPAALALLASGLERLDQRLPRVLLRADELLVFAHQLLLEEPAAGTCAAACLDFLSRRRIAAEFEAHLALARELDGQARLAWPQRQQLISRIEARLQGHEQSLQRTLGVTSSAEESLRGGLVKLRLLRLAVDAHLGRQPAHLPDPMGQGPLLVQATPTGPRFTSAATPDRPYLERSASPRP